MEYDTACETVRERILAAVAVRNKALRRFNDKSSSYDSWLSEEVGAGRQRPLPQRTFTDNARALAYHYLCAAVDRCTQLYVEESRLDRMGPPQS